MLYIFQVDSGTMLTLEMNLALESVANLKQVISQLCKIPEEKQVLLVSGGYILETTARVCHYSAGTDTSPIFLFNKINIENNYSPSPSLEPGEEVDMKEKVDGSLNMPPTYNTVISRAQLAQQFFEISKDQRRSCERLVHTQHLMQQGWAAAVANLDDITNIFISRSEAFERNFNQYLENRPSHLALLQNFCQDLNLLSKIPVLPILLKDQDEGSTSVNLLNWISSKDNQNSLEQIAKICTKCLEKFDCNVLKGLLSEVQIALKDVDNRDFKEIKGIELRLSELEKLMFTAKKIVDDQGGLAQAFHQNQNRASNLKDASILPDLCSSHKQQLQLVLQNHEMLRDIKERCFLAKAEFCANLHLRLRWIMFVEGKLNDIDNKLSIYNENLKRIKGHLEVVRQIHLAPRVYLASVAEVVRRRQFSKVFLEWAGQLSDSSQTLHQKELEVRKSFNGQLTNHFLLTLFPGLDDAPPPFATQRPSPFDVNLPRIERSDVELLRLALPELDGFLNSPGEDPFLPPSSSGFISLDPSSSDRPGVSTSTQTLTSESGLETTRSATSSNETSQKRQSSNSSVNLEKGTNDGFQPISEEVWLGEDFETVEKIDGLSTTPLLLLAGKNSPSGRLIQQEEEKGKEKKNSQKISQLHKAGSEPGVSLILEDSQLQRARSEGDIQQGGEVSATVTSSHPLEMRPELGSPALSQDFMTADFYIDESMPSSYTESNGTSARTGAPSGGPQIGHMTKSHHVVVAELQSQLEDKTSSLSSAQEDLEAKTAELREHSSSLHSLHATLQEILVKDKQSLADIKEQILLDKNRVTGELEEITKRIAAAFIELKAELEQEKDLKRKCELALEERILGDMAELDDIFLSEPDFQNEIKDSESEFIQDENKKVNFSKLFKVFGEFKNRKEQSKSDAIEILIREDYDKRLKDVQEHLDSVLSEKQNNKDMQILSDNQLKEEIQKKHLEEIKSLRCSWSRSCRQLPPRLEAEEIVLVWHRLREITFNQSREEGRLNDPSEIVRLLSVKFEEQQEEHHDETAAILANRYASYVIEAYLSIDKNYSTWAETEIRHWKERDTLFTQACLKQLKSLRSLCCQGQYKDKDVMSLDAFDVALSHFLRSLRSHHQRSYPDKLNLELNKEEAFCQRKLALLQMRDTLKNTFNEALLSIKSRLEIEKEQLRSRLNRANEQIQELEEQNRRVMISSILPEQGEPSSPTSEILPSQQTRLTSSTPLATIRSPFSDASKVSVLKCNVDDLVLLTYDEKHESYVVFILDSTLHFLKTDCLESLGLNPVLGHPRRAWALGVVTEKEYCKARKFPNRYRVQLDIRFYRVSVKPWSIPSVPFPIGP